MNVMPFGPGWGQAKRTAVSGPSPVSDLLYQSFYDTLPGWFTFTRASSAWGFNSAGVLTQFANDVSRQVYDPVTLAPQGTLIEPTGTNLARYSSDQTNAVWTKNGSTTTGAAGTAPDGTMTAVRITEGSGAGVHIAYQGVTKAASALPFAWSFFFRAGSSGSRNIAVFASDGAGSSSYAVVSPVNGSIIAGPITAGTFTGAAIVVQALPNGWYRGRLTFTSSTAALINAQMVMASGSSTSYTGDGASNLLVWGAQLEQSSWVSSYIPTTTAVATRAADSLALPLPFAGFPGAVGWSAMMEFMPTGLPGNVAAFRLTGSAGNFSAAQVNGTANINAMKSVGGSNIVSSATVTSLTVGVPIKLAMAQDTTDLRLSLGGSAIVVSTNAGYPAMDTLGILPAQPGTVRRLRLWPRKLSDAELQGVTA